jgi:hypothetical protein
MSMAPELILSYRGEPVARVRLYRAPTLAPDSPVVEAAAEFWPLSGYGAVQPVVRRAGEARGNFGFLGPAADPLSAERGLAAEQAAREVWSELQVEHSLGPDVNARVFSFTEHYLHMMGVVQDVFLEFETRPARPSVRSAPE